MFNVIAKSLVLLHTIFSLAALTLALVVFISARDMGWGQPSQAVHEYDPNGSPKQGATESFASEYDKSWAAATQAARTRDRTYASVQPAIDSIRQAEPYLANNHLYFLSEMKRLREATGNIEVRRQKDGGALLETVGSKLGRPALEDNPVAMLTLSYKGYEGELKKVGGEIDAVEGEIRKIVVSTKSLTFQLTGTDETNKYVQPGLYQLVDQEFKAQTQIRLETELIKPSWSKAVEQSRLFRYRRDDLEATLQKLKPAPK